MPSKTITMTCELHAPVARVWQLWTEPEEVMKWWGPKHFTAPKVIIDLREGGTCLYCMRGPKGSEYDKDMWSMGVIQELVPMKKIVTTDHFCDEKGNIISPKEFGMPGDWTEDMMVTTTFEDMGDGTTKLTVVHEGHPVEIADMAKQGWEEQLDKLEAMI